jgi:hypothetical protein
MTDLEPVFSYQNELVIDIEWMFQFNPLMPELNPSTQRCLMRFFTGDFAT